MNSLMQTETPSRQNAPLECPDCIILSHQRSGTHLLQSFLCSHPNIHGRGEFVLRYKKSMLPRPPPGVLDTSAFFNKTGRYNIGIVMYSQVSLFESACASLSSVRILHLLRRPRDVAVSIARMKVDHVRLGDAYRAHYMKGEAKPRASEFVESIAEEWEAKVRAMQEKFTALLSSRSDALPIDYTEMTNDREADILPPELEGRILQFLGQVRRPLTTTLAKCGPCTPTSE